MLFRTHRPKNKLLWPFISFTYLAHQSGHADQSHGNKQCGKWTGYSPSQLLQVGTALGEQDTFWRLSHPVGRF